jgi:hypothetical protein
MSHWESVGKSDEWYTPKYIFDALGCEFDLDVAHPKQQTFVPAKEYFTENSLEKEWHGFVWMNPPFGGRNGIVPWLDKFVSHGNGIALVPDRTSASWFQHYAKYTDLMLFMSPKVKFIRPDGSLGKSPNVGTVLWGIGEKAENALFRAKSLGFLARKTLVEKE